MAENRIQQALARHFERQRIVFWYDDKQEFRSVFDSLEMDGVEKIEINANEFTVKHRILRESPKQNFLLYIEGKEPAYINNWLLDVQLCSDVFRTDQSAIWLSELELPPSRGFSDNLLSMGIHCSPSKPPMVMRSNAFSGEGNRSKSL